MSAFASPIALSIALSFALLPIPSGTANAQTMFKCLKGTAVTYSNTSCEQLGLKSAGPVRDRMTTLPMGGSSQGAQAKGPSASAGSSGGGGKPKTAMEKANEIDMPPTSSVKPVNPLIEKLAK